MTMRVLYGAAPDDLKNYDTRRLREAFLIEDLFAPQALRFTYTLEIAGVPDGSQEERDYAAGMEADYLKAVEATLAAVRKIAAGEKVEA